LALSVSGVDPPYFRLIAPYESDPDAWLQLPWVDLHTGTLHPVTADPNDHRSELARLKTYRDVLLLYALHPEPKSLDPDGQPCNRRSPPGLLARRPVTLLTLSLIGKESNRLEETIAGLIGSLDDTLATYNSPSENAWTILVLPALADFPTRQLAALTELDDRAIQRIKKRATNTPHDQNRALLTLITAQLARQQLEAWGIAPPPEPPRANRNLPRPPRHLQARPPPRSLRHPTQRPATALLLTSLQQTSPAGHSTQGLARPSGVTQSGLL
jgi:hypothetical protein